MGPGTVKLINLLLNFFSLLFCCYGIYGIVNSLASHTCGISDAIYYRHVLALFSPVFKFYFLRIRV